MHPVVVGASRRRLEGPQAPDVHRSACRSHGRQLAVWKEAGIDPIAVARRLWGRTRRAALSGPGWPLL